MSSKVVDRDTYVAAVRAMDSADYSERVVHTCNRSVIFLLDEMGRAMASASYVKMGRGVPCQIIYRLRA